MRYIYIVFIWSFAPIEHNNLKFLARCSNLSAEHYKEDGMVDIRPTIVFDARLMKEANRIASGEIQTILPFRYGLHKGFKIFLFFPNLLPDPKLFDATITHVAVGSPADLQTSALNAGKDVYVMLDETTRDCSAMAISWSAVPVPLSQEEVVNCAYAEGKIPIPE